MYCKKALFFVFLGLISISGCKQEEKDEPGLGRFGMLNDGTPQYTAVNFMQSIYDDPNIDNALSLSTERLARVMNRYRTNRNVQRNVINLMFDTVKVTPEGRRSIGRPEFSKKATVHLFLTGYYGEDKIDDIRTIELVKVSGDWRVDEVLPDKFF